MDGRTDMDSQPTGPERLAELHYSSANQPRKVRNGHLTLSGKPSFLQDVRTRREFPATILNHTAVMPLFLNTRAHFYTTDSYEAGRERKQCATTHRQRGPYLSRMLIGFLSIGVLVFYHLKFRTLGSTEHAG